MKRSISEIILIVGKIDRRHVQLALLILSLCLLVIGTGAPGGAGGGDGGSGG